MANITVTGKLETLADWGYENISKLLKQNTIKIERPSFSVSFQGLCCISFEYNLDYMPAWITMSKTKS